MDQYNSDYQRGQRVALRETLDRHMRASGLGAALEELRRHQVASGFIQDDLSEVLRFEFPRPDSDRDSDHDNGSADDYFSVQYNPARARRFAGRGTRQPPPWARSVNGDCFLCAENIEWQQGGAEVGYRVAIGELPYTAWMNPFPLARGHAVVAADAHIHQHWSESGIGLGNIVTDLIELAGQLPGWITFYNGVGAGASIETHLHYHAMPRTPGLGPLPIERAADRHRVDLSDDSALTGAVARKLYPLDFAHWRGPAAALLDPVLRWINAWQNERGHGADATANAMALRHADGPDMDFFFVPRVRSRSRAEGFGGVIGAFETMGEIICSTPAEKRLIANGEISYWTIADMLRHVSVAL